MLDIPQSSLVDLVLQKVDAETSKASPLGSATLKDAQFQISYYDRYLVVPYLMENALNAIAHGQDVQSSRLSIPSSWGNPQRTWIFKTDAEGKLMFSKEYLVEGDEFYYDHEGAIALPLGTIEIKEIKAPEGYLLLEEPLVISLQEQGSEPHIEKWQSITTPEQVKRGDFSFTKTREGSMERLANIPFRITSNTTGESHILITDENGMASTESSWAAHSHNTNQAASSEDGIWFGTDSLGNTASVNDELGALPYDTYTVEEMPCSANEGMLLVAFEVTISRDKVTLDLGTIDNKPYTPEITGEVDKLQTLFESNGLFTYTIDYRSTSPTWADEFTTTDSLVCAQENQAHLKALATPVSVGDFDEKMNVWYQTNKTVSGSEEANACSANPYNPDNPNNERVYNFDGWHLWTQDLSTTKSTILYVDDLDLPEDEYITALAFEHGRVEEGFGTLSQDDEQWQRRDRYENNDTRKEAPDTTQFDSWNDQTCNQVLDSLDTVSSTHAPAVLFMQATTEMLESEDIELWNDARIDIYRNLELHDEDKDSVVQTTTQHPIDSSDNPLKELIDTLPKTGDDTFGLFIFLSALGIGSIGALIYYRKNKRI